MAPTLTTREHLLEVGLRQLRATGYTATGVKELLDLAKVPKGSVPDVLLWDTNDPYYYCDWRAFSRCSEFFIVNQKFFLL